MNKRYRPIILFLVLIGLAVFFTTEVRYTFALLRSRFLNEPADMPQPQVVASTARYEPLYQGVETIAIDTGAAAGTDNSEATALDGMDVQEIADFRAARVAKYASLNIFPAGYTPFQGTGAKLFKNISPGAQWIAAASYYIANPYGLIILSCARQVMPVNLKCRDGAITYSEGRIEETLGGESAQCFFDMVFGETAEFAGTLQVTMVNAYDSGFYFAGIDAEQSRNINPGAHSGAIVSGIFSQPAAYHQGAKDRKNTISTENKKGWITLLQRDAPTKIVVKLWRNKPQSAADPADMLYVISVEP
jgi:hypothetical protein